MQIMLLGDMMGTKSHLLAGDIDTLHKKYTAVTNCFANCYRLYHRRSRSMFCLTFSDSVIAVWDDFNEGRRFCHLFARDLYQQLCQSQVTARVFIDKGEIVSSVDNRFELYSAIESRFISFSPISFGSWSVFGGEEAHFAPGMYVGTELCSELPVSSGLSFSDLSCIVGRFSYRRMIEQGTS